MNNIDVLKKHKKFIENFLRKKDKMNVTLHFPDEADHFYYCVECIQSSGVSKEFAEKVVAKVKEIGLEEFQQYAREFIKRGIKGEAL